MRNFYLGVDEQSTPKFLFYSKRDKRYILRIRLKGYIPKTGLLVCNHLHHLIKNKKVLEIGTGETGIIAIHCAIYGASEVLACDIDREAIIWAIRNGKLNKLTNVKWKVSDVFQEIGSDRKFDLIVSNPPQMPMEFGPLHDWGGLDGRDCIKKIIEAAREYLLPSGRLLISLFDFIGAVEQYGKKPSLLKYLEEKGLKPSVVETYKKIIRQGGQTEKSLNYIKQIYPEFRFQKDRFGNLFHQVFIVSAALNNCL